MDPTIGSTWGANWLWSLPLIAVTVAFHSFALEIINRRLSLLLDRYRSHHLPHGLSMMIMGSTALCATILHGVEGAIWAVAYLLLSALPNSKSAMLYSLEAMTSYGHANVYLESHWQLMGSLEALNGWILFGLTTAFLFTVIQKIWPHNKPSS